MDKCDIAYHQKYLKNAFHHYLTDDARWLCSILDTIQLIMGRGYKTVNDSQWIKDTNYLIQDCKYM